MKRFSKTSLLCGLRRLLAVALILSLTAILVTGCGGDERETEAPVETTGRVSNTKTDTQPTASATAAETMTTIPATTVLTYPVNPAPDFLLTDQYGAEHSLEHYRGQIVLLNFWATWCEPCQMELPEMERFYQENGKNEGEVVILGVVNPTEAGGTQMAQEKDVSGVKAFLKEQGIEFPTLLDTDAEAFSLYHIHSFPTTFFIGPDGSMIDFITGAMTYDMMVNLVDQVRAMEPAE